MRIEVIGELRIVGPDVTVVQSELGGPLVQAALAFLVLHRRAAVPASVVAEALWPDGVPPTWDASLRNAATRVRRALRTADHDGGGTVETRQGALRMALPPAATVDIEELAGLLIEARSDLDAGAVDDARRRGALAIELASQPLLPQIDGEWANAARRAHEQQLVVALEIGAIASVATDPLAAIDLAERLLAIDPYREHAHRVLMQAHHANGERAAALAAYERARQLLATELGVEPSAETEAVFREVLGAAPPDRRAAPTGEIPIVGRDAALDGLDGWWKRVTPRAVRAIAIAGEPGIGKSRLADEYTTRLLANGANVLYGRCDEGGRVPFQPFVDVATFARHTTAPVWLRPDREGVAELREHDDVDDEERAFDALATWIVAMADEQPVVLVIDDAHWAGAHTLQVVRRLLRTRPACGLGVILTYRDAEVSATHPLAAMFADLRRADALDDLALAGLHADAIRTILEHVDPGHASVAVAEQVALATGGNPFFVTETARRIADRGKHGSITDLLSPGVRDVVLARVGALGPDAFRDLEVAAVLGNEVDVTVLARAAGRSIDAVLESVDAAMRAHLLVAVPHAPARCRFAHHLVVSALVEQLTPARRTSLHRAAGLALALDPAAEPAVVAHHLIAAAHVGLGDDVVRWSRLAARRAGAAYAYDDAIAVLTAALACDLPAAGRAELLVELADARWRANDLEGAHADAAAAFALVDEAGDAIVRARAALAAVRSRRGAPALITNAAHVPLLRRALDGLPEGEIELRLRLLGALATHTSDPTERTRLALEAMELARATADAAAVVAAFDASRVALWSPARVEERLAFADAALAVVDDLHLRAPMVVARAGDLLQLGRLDAADAAIADLDTQVADQPSRRLRWSPRVWDGMRALLRGDAAAALTAVDGALAVWAGTPDEDALVAYGLQRGLVALLDGDLDHALAIADAGIATYGMQLEYGAARALLLVVAGRPAEAVALLDELLRWPGGPLPSATSFDVVAALLAEVVGRTRHAEGAATLLPATEAMAAQWVTLPAPGVEFGPGDLARGWLHLAAGDLDAAVRAFIAAAELADRLGAPVWAALARLAAIEAGANDQVTGPVADPAVAAVPRVALASAP